MSAPYPQKPHDRGIDWSQFQVMGAVILIALGGVFLAQQAGILSESSNWWVIFLFIPGVGLLWSAASSHRPGRPWAGIHTVEVILGVVLVLLTLIFIFDPNWTFLDFDRILPNVDWDRVWPFFLVVPGVLMLAVGLVRRLTGIAVLGALLILLGGVFIFDIDWNYVWPLALILPGVWLLLAAGRRRTE
jgi:hypothetical protein